MANKYQIGNVVQMSVEFQDPSGTDTDPSSVTAEVKDPAGVVTSPAPVKDATGKYHIDFTTVLAGVHYYRFSGSGGLTVASETAFVVVPSQFS